MNELADLSHGFEAPHRVHVGVDDDGLLGRIELIESQPLEQRAAQFEQMHDELLTELQRGDHGVA